MSCFAPFRVLGITYRDDGGDGALKTIVNRDANVLVVCVREAEWFIANLVRAMERARGFSLPLLRT